MNTYSMLGIGLLSGTIIGAGIFSLPYVFSQIGIFAGIGYLILFASIYASVYSMYASLLAKEEGAHDFFFLAKKYLPVWAVPTVIVTTIGGLLFALLAYLTLISPFVSFAWGVGGWWIIFIFWVVSSLFIFVKVNALGWAEFFGTASILCAVLFIAFLAFGSLASAQAPSSGGIVSFSLILMPFGPILFSFAGRSAISQVVRIWKEGKKAFSLYAVIRGGVFIPAVVYIIFALSIIVLSPYSVSGDSLSGLVTLPFYAKTILAIVGFFTLWTSYIMLTNNTRDILLYDMRFPKVIAFGVPILIPLFLLFLGLDDFMEVVEIAGGIFVALEGLFMVWMWYRAFPRHPLRKYAYIPIAVFAVSFIYICTTLFV